MERWGPLRAIPSRRAARTPCTRKARPRQCNPHPPHRGGSPWGVRSTARVRRPERVFLRARTDRFDCLDSLGRALELDALGESSALTRVRFSAPTSARSGIARVPECAPRFVIPQNKSAKCKGFCGFRPRGRACDVWRRRVAVRDQRDRKLDERWIGVREMPRWTSPRARPGAHTRSRAMSSALASARLSALAAPRVQERARPRSDAPRLRAIAARVSAPANRRRAGRFVPRASSDDAEDATTGLAHAEYLRSVAAIAPAELGALVSVLRAQGGTPVAPSARDGLHPLCHPPRDAGKRHGVPEGEPGGWGHARGRGGVGRRAPLPARADVRGVRAQGDGAGGGGSVGRRRRRDVGR